MMENEEESAPDLPHDDDADSKMNTGDSSPTKVFLTEFSRSKVSAEGKDSTKCLDHSGYHDSPLSKSVDFVFETKYVMLNFMSLVPHDMYSGHISSSLESASPDPHSPHSPHMRHISKSKSFDIGSLHSRRPRLKQIGRLRSTRHVEIDSPVSEDNVTNRYHWNRLDSPDETRFDSDPGSQHAPWDLPFENPIVQHVSAHQLSPRKPLYLVRSQSSVISSSGDLSYMSDADDEADDLSNASSIFSSQSLHNRDGFLDLRKSVHIMPPLPSQSEETDEADGEIIESERSQLCTNTQKSIDGGAHHGSDAVDSAVENEANATGGGDLAECWPRSIADRTKLKLNIPCEPLHLDDILLSLQTELSSEIDDLESEFEEALKSARSSVYTPLTPQSEAARVLARIGDEVKVQYGSQLSAAVSRLTYEQINSLTYDQFRDIALTMMDKELPGWSQVALLMVFGQRLIWNAVQHGQKQFGGIIDYCSQLVADVAADFIIKQGGWGSVMNFDPSQSSDTLSSAELDTSNDMHDFFSSHNVTQVESHDMAAAVGEGNGTEALKAEKVESNEQTGSGLVKLSEIGNVGNKGTNLLRNGSQPVTYDEVKNKRDKEAVCVDSDSKSAAADGDTGNGETPRFEHMISESDDSEIFSTERDGVGDITSGFLKPTGPVSKLRYASSVGFEIDESGETMDTEDDSSLAYLHDPADNNDDDRSDMTIDDDDEILELDFDSDNVTASTDISNGNLNFFYLNGSQAANNGKSDAANKAMSEAKSDAASLTIDLNKDVGNVGRDYNGETVYIKLATPNIATYLDSTVVSAVNSTNTPGRSTNNTNDSPTFQDKDMNNDGVVKGQKERLDNKGSRTFDVPVKPYHDIPEQSANSRGDVNFNNVPSEKYSALPYGVAPEDTMPSPESEDNADHAELNVNVEESQLLIDTADDSTPTYQREANSVDISENQRETIHCDESSNERETTLGESLNQNEAANTGSIHFHRGVKVSVITLAALAVAVCVKMASR